MAKSRTPLRRVGKRPHAERTTRQEVRHAINAGDYDTIAARQSSSWSRTFTDAS